MKRLIILTAVVAFATFGSISAEDSKEVAGLKEQQKKLYQQKRTADVKLRTHRMRIEKSDALSAERESRAVANTALSTKEKNSPELASLRKAAQEANRAVTEMLEEMVASDKTVKSARKKLAKLEDKRAEREIDKAIAQVKLSHRSSPVQRALAGDEELRALQSKAHKGGRNSDEAKAHQAARKAKMESMSNAKKLMNEIADCQEESEEMYKEIRAEYDKISKRRFDIDHGKDEDLVAVKKKRDVANRAYRTKADKEVLVAERKDVDTANRAFGKKLQELLAADAEAAPFIAEMKAVDQQSRDIYGKIKQLENAQRQAAGKKK